MKYLEFRPSETFKVIADKVFKEQKQKILEQLAFVEVEHVGATPIHGLLTKCDLDVNVRVNKDNFDKTLEILKEMYEINQPDNWTNTFASFKDDKNLEIDFGVQLTIVDSPEDYFVKQRDILLQNPALVKELNHIKEWYEVEGKSMDEYRKAKSEFFDRILKKHEKL